MLGSLVWGAFSHLRQPCCLETIPVRGGVRPGHCGGLRPVSRERVCCDGFPLALPLASRFLVLGLDLVNLVQWPEVTGCVMEIALCGLCFCWGHHLLPQAE